VRDAARIFSRSNGTCSVTHQGAIVTGSFSPVNDTDSFPLPDFTIPESQFNLMNIAIASTAMEIIHDI
jgi:hypothetical protein